MRGAVLVAVRMGIEDFTEFEQRTAYFDGDIVTATIATLRIRYRVLKLRALMFVLRRLMARAERLARPEA